MEWAVGVPGSVGGAVRMNAGGHGSDISRHLSRCRWIDLKTDEISEIPTGGMDFSYRHSAVGPFHVVLEASFDLGPGDSRTSEATIREIVRWRRDHQPGGQNAGSVFTNPGGPPPSDSAGWLIEAAGLKGLRRGTAMVSDKHANFIQADPGGSANDVYALIHDVKTLVMERMGVVLQTEVQCRGF
jgi:UDP-N-acetylmuramate dehydrogenase